MVVTRVLELKTQAGYDVQDITPQVFRAVEESKINSGIVTIFCPGSTGGLTTLEFEPGVVADLRQVLDEIIPPDRDYRHHARWSHVVTLSARCTLSVMTCEGRRQRQFAHPRRVDGSLAHCAVCGQTPGARHVAANRVLRI